MNRICWLVYFGSSIFLLASTPGWTSKPVPSPDGLFEAHSTPENLTPDIHGDFYGEKLYVRKCGSNENGVLLRENSRYMEIQWAPRSHLLGVEDHWDGHSCGVYVYAISTEIKSGHIQYKLVFQSPNNDYDRIWTIVGWDMRRRTIHLKCDRRYQPEGSGGYEFDRFFVIGTRALSEKS
jgi:hypothetical protein